jgi:hypothetical protein
MTTTLALRPALAALLGFTALFSAGCPRYDCERGDETGANVQMVPFSGRFGYGLSGPYGFLGSLTNYQLTDQAWRLDGSFVFPTGGYTVDEPVILVAESYPEQVSVTLRVTPPAPDAIVTQAVSVVPVTADITASNEARFNIRVTGAAILPCPDTVQVTLKNDKDKWVLESGATAPRLLITCPSGIGEATIQFNPSCPLKKLLIGLRYDQNRPFARLENFDATSENTGPITDFSSCVCPGFVQVELPETALMAENGLLTLRWVDMYR